LTTNKRIYKYNNYWLPKESGAMQPRSKAPNNGSLVFCPYCQNGIYVNDYGFLNTKWVCANCKKQLTKNRLIIDLIKWRKYNNLSLSHVGTISITEEEEKELDKLPKYYFPNSIKNEDLRE
tara:strand:+ start:4769 stop:5131 length:363 start_codon:yes stop_codon:yes gene_type:complete